MSNLNDYLPGSLRDGRGGPRRSESGAQAKAETGLPPMRGAEGRPVRPGSRGWEPSPEDACPICHGAGYLLLERPVGHPEFGKAVPCQCRKEELIERRLRAVSAVGAQESVKHLTFETFMPEGQSLAPDKAANLRRACDSCLTFAQNPEGWLLLTGTYGCGKTHLAAAIVNITIQAGRIAIFLNTPDLLDHLRAAYAPDAELSYDALFDRLRNAPLLVLDDLGAQSSTPWALEKLFQLLNHRYNLRLPTVITTNQRLDDIEPRLRSRIQDLDLTRRVHITAPDFRLGGAAGQFDLSMLALFQDKRFDTFDEKRPVASTEERAVLHSVVQTCRQFAQQPAGWLVLAGANGCGKTHLAAAIANAQRDAGSTDVMLIAVPDLLDALRATFSPQVGTNYDRRFDEIRRVPLLVLDDLGTESATPWAREKLLQLLNFRFSAALPTVITTSQDLDTLDPWLRTRFLDSSRCRYCAITAGPYRNGGATGKGGWTRGRNDSPRPSSPRGSGTRGAP